MDKTNQQPLYARHFWVLACTLACLVPITAERGKAWALSIWDSTGEKGKTTSKPGVAKAAGKQPRRLLGATDLALVHELYRLTDLLGDKLWPGFDTRKIPIAINNEDRQEMLIGHPRPPAEFKPFEGSSLAGQKVYIREGCTFYGPRGGGWARELGGVWVAYVGLPLQGQPIEDYLTLLLHECFHVFQHQHRQGTQGRLEEPPEDNPQYAALLALESRLLHAALLAKDPAETRRLTGQFVAVRRLRRSPLSADVIRTEGEQEYGEGTATYTQPRLYRLLAQAGGIKPLGDVPSYKGFQGATQQYRDFLNRILLPRGQPVTFFHAMYNHGMAQGLLLDGFRPSWKEEMRKKGANPFQVLEREFPVDRERDLQLANQAKAKFDYLVLLREQEKLVNDKLATIRGYIQAQGRRYRIYHGDLLGPFRWKPEGPVYHVPQSLLKETYGADKASSSAGAKTTPERFPRTLIWVGGIKPFEKGNLLFESGKVPIIFRQDFMEWIDSSPTKDGRNQTITSSRQEANVYYNLKVTTRGFVLKVPRARVVSSEKIIAIHPLPDR